MHSLSSSSLFVFALVALAGCAAGSGDSVGSAEPEMLSAGSPATTLVSCTDTDDATTTASLTVDSSFRFGWKIGDMRPAVATLTDVTKTVRDDFTYYTFHLASGEFISLDIGNTGTGIAFSGLSALCAPKTPVREDALEPLLAATASSVAKKQTFATCTFHGDGAEVPQADTFTVRPSLDGHGAVFEQSSNEDSDQSFVLLAHKLITTGAGQSTRSVYEGQGGVAVFGAGQHVSSVSQLSVTGSSPSTIQWNWQEPLPASECNVTGGAYAKSLLH